MIRNQTCFRKRVSDNQKYIDVFFTTIQERKLFYINIYEFCNTVPKDVLKTHLVPCYCIA